MAYEIIPVKLSGMNHEKTTAYITRVIFGHYSFEVPMLLLEEIWYQLRFVVYPIILQRVLYIPGGWPWDF